MNLKDLRVRTQRYIRDTAGKRFSTDLLDSYINEGVDRMRSYITFSNMPYPNLVDNVAYLPESYHYMLSLYGASRCFENDNNFYQADQKRNEFENMFADLMTRIEMGDLTIKDERGNVITDVIDPIDFVKIDSVSTQAEE